MKNRVRNDLVEKFPGICSMDLKRFDEFDEKEFKEKVKEMSIHKRKTRNRCWWYDKYLISQQCINPVYLLFVHKSNKNRA